MVDSVAAWGTRCNAPVLAGDPEPAGMMATGTSDGRRSDCSTEHTRPAGGRPCARAFPKSSAAARPSPAPRDGAVDDRGRGVADRGDLRRGHRREHDPPGDAVADRLLPATQDP